MTTITCPRCGGTYHTASPQIAHVCPYCELSQEKEKEFRRKLDLFNKFYYWLMPQEISRRKK